MVDQPGSRPGTARLGTARLVAAPGRRSTGLAPVLGALAADLAVGVGAAALCWPARYVAPSGGLDTGWRWLVARAAREHLRFGHDIVFTYGPLGWLFEPAGPSGGQMVASTVFVAVVYAVGFAALTRLLRARLPGVLAAAVVLVLSTQLLVSVAELSASLLTCVLLVRLLVVRRPPGPGTVAVVSVAAGLLLTMKIGTGSLAAAAAVLVAIAVGLTRSRPPGEGRVAVGRVLGALVVVAVALPVSFAAAWLAAGQRLADVLPYARGSQEIQTGYQSAMTYEQPGRAWEWTAVGVGLALLVLAGALGTVAEVPADRLRVATAVGLGLGVTWYMLLQAFVRHGGTHDVSGQEAALVVVLGLLGGLGAEEGRSPTAAPDRRSGPALLRRRRAAVAAGLAALVWVASCAVAAVGTDVWDIAPSRVRQLRADLRLTGDPAFRAAVDSGGLARARATAAYPPAVRAALGTGPVTPVPWAVTEVVASGFALRTLPVPQTYTAYTPYLDQLNADALLAADGPSTVLRQYGLAIDQRNPMWESPQASLVLLCHYREVVVAGGYQVLRRGPRVCAVGSEVLGTHEVPAGSTTPVAVPAPRRAGDGVLVSIELRWSPLDQLRRRLVRQPGSVLVGGGRRSFRLVPDTGAGPLLLRAPTGVWSGRTLTTQDQAALRFVAPVALRVTFRELDRTG